MWSTLIQWCTLPQSLSPEFGFSAIGWPEAEPIFFQETRLWHWVHLRALLLGACHKSFSGQEGSKCEGEEGWVHLGVQYLEMILWLFQ